MMTLPMLVAEMGGAGTTVARTTIFGWLTDLAGGLIRRPYPIYLANDFGLLVRGLRYFDTTDGTAKYHNTASITAFLTDSDAPDAEAIAPDAQIDCPYLAGSNGDYLVAIDAATLTDAVLGEGVFDRVLYLIVQEADGFRVAWDLSPARVRVPA